MKNRIQSQTRGTNRRANGITTALGYFSLGLGVAEIVAPGAIAKLVGINEKPRRNRSRFVSPLYGAREVTAGIGLLSRRNSKAWMWSRVAGDVLDLGTLALALRSKRTDRTRAGFAMAAVAGISALDFIAAQRLSRAEPNGHALTDQELEAAPSESRASILVNRPVEEVYDFWRDFTNFPRFMRHLESVDALSEGRSRWRARGPFGKRIEWEAIIEREQPNRLLSWRSIEGSDVDNSGTVTFEAGPGNRGTLVRVELEYQPPGGRAGAGLAKFLRKDPSKMLADDLRAFKQVMETGEVILSEPPPRRHKYSRDEDPTRDTLDDMEEAELGIGANSRREDSL